MKDYVALMWIGAIGLLVVSVAALVVSFALSWPLLVRHGCLVCVVASVGAIAAIELRYPLQK